MKNPNPKASNKPSARSSAPADKPVNQYLLALLTAILAGVFSIGGGYFVARFQADSAILQKQLEYRAVAYGNFLEKTTIEKSPKIGLLLSLGLLGESFSTDSDLQQFEDRMAKFMERSSPRDLYWQLSAEFNLLRLHGSDKVSGICSDILQVLANQDYQIDWGKYPESTLSSYKIKKSVKDLPDYAVDGKVSSDERMMFFTVALLHEELLSQLRRELHVR